MPAEGSVASPGLVLDIGRARGTVVVTVSGDLDVASSDVLAELLRDLIGDQGNLAVAVDVARMVVVDPDGLAVLLDATTLAHERGGTLSLYAASSTVYHLLERAGSAMVPNTVGNRHWSPPCPAERADSASRLWARSRHPSADTQHAPHTSS